MVAVLSMVYCENKQECLDVIKLLIERGANVNLRSCDGETALHIASSFQLYDAAKILIENGASVNIIDDNNSTPLHRAIYNQNKNDIYYKLVKLLIINGANPFYGKSEYSIYKEPIKIAYSKNDLKLLEILKAGTDTGIPEYYTSKRKFISENSRRIFSILYDYGINIISIETVDFLYKHRFLILFVPVMFSILMCLLFRNKTIFQITVFQIIMFLLCIFVVFPILLVIGLSHDS